ncbi:hypothetical protein [Streptomyces sp. XD-27]|uniref:hypothetical protein n=1 Tax=Streptomyces sp. XD-27 TaxID=3062779 RepID=UPI0026F4190E|nr:hypothetical protein [Streptomyces sp. XD-27]WKX70284.1 hypothetical protein Q3Y56_10445 [Streptomyces sp. XD-27]
MTPGLPTHGELLTEIAAVVTTGLSHTRAAHPAANTEDGDGAGSATALPPEHRRAA